MHWKEGTITSVSFRKALLYLQLLESRNQHLTFQVNRADKMQGCHSCDSNNSAYRSTTTAYGVLNKNSNWLSAWLIANRKVSWGEHVHILSCCGSSL